MDTQPNFQPLPALPGNGVPVVGNPPQPESSQEEGSFNIDHLLGTLRRRSLLLAGVTIAATSFMWYRALTQAPSYQSGFRLLVEPVTAENTLQNLTDTSTRQFKLDYATQIEVLRSPELLQPIANQIQKQYPGFSYGELISNLTVSQPKGTKILDIRYSGSDPQKVKYVLDQVSEGYLRYSQLERQTNLRRGIQFVEEQIAKVQERVNSLQIALQTFRQRNNFIDPDSQSQRVSTQITALEQQRLEVQKQLAEVRSTYDSLQIEPGAVAALANSPSYQAVLGQIRELDSKIAIESARFREGNLALQLLEDQKQKLVPLLRQEARRSLGNKLAEVESQLRLLEVRQQAIANAEQYWTQQFKRLPITSRQYTDLQRDLRVATESLTRFLETRENLQVQAAQQEVPWQLIAAPALPGAPLSSIGRDLLIGALAGLALGIAAAMVAEKLDNTFHSSEELRKQLKRPILAIIPFYEAVQPEPKAPSKIKHLFQPARLKSLVRGRRRPPTSRTTSIFLEAFRSLHANIRLLRTDPPITTLVISSALPGDGKSTVAINLAQAAASMGQRVLLVDADMRKPRIGSRLGIPSSRGLRDLIETNTRPSRVIQQFHRSTPEEVSDNPQILPFGAENLYVLTSGEVSQDPAKLLSTQRMQDLMEHFQTIFDLVIYDAPPLLNLADSSLLGAHADGVVLVAGLGKTDRTALLQALETLRLSRIPVLGIVANNLRSATSATVKHYYYQT
ncbi:polysaccharide biosynthesis tyrosine autokinase [Leptothermofonsia sichuanensis E412]|uniref:GumC family protein n=1 Tax=Leptothermofonsia sichuanensis TaxID=2917832 RepID=UPI001CA63419|nr:polysaccharide biosynthesis tyrosine autokinase [Leptothermofonsia sichuanensis]QZZ21815.1 polysaccharide biosynthesis tyrosine autokinase [Leptothermofonsia sichuanensis E412]